MTTRVGVYPPAALRSRARLFDALAQALPARFEALDRLPGSPSDPVVVLDADLDRPVPGAGRRFVAGTSSSSGAETQSVSFGDSAALDARLRSRTLEERRAAVAALVAKDGDDVLASADGRPVWIRRRDGGPPVDVAAHAPGELTDGEYLRDRVDPGSFLGLLPLLHFLRDVTADGAWDPAPTRATFVVDDPNLHWRSYGCLSYRELVAAAREQHYHVSIATVPLDTWFTHRPTARLFRESTDVLSLSVHGNDHLLRELGQPATREEARRLVAQARRRIASFERRTGLAVSPVMVPPYEATSPLTLDALLDVGYEAATVTRPCTWLPLEPSLSPYATPDADDVLSGWYGAELTEQGLPILIRRQFHEHDEIVLRSFLDQPVILYGHAEDLTDGLEPLARSAAVVNSLPSVTWGSLGALAETNVETRRHGDELQLRPFGRRIRLQVEPDVARMRIVRPPRPAGFGHGVSVSVAGGDATLVDATDDVLELQGDRRDAVAVTLRWHPPEPVDPVTVPPPRRRAAAVARRLVVEARDRMRPLRRR